MSGPVGRVRMRGRLDRPQGLRYQEDVLSPAEEAAVLAELEPLHYREVRLWGQPARRVVRHFGYRYEYETWRLVPADPLPAALEPCASGARPWPAYPHRSSPRPW